jgi:hypothetical protein
MRGTVAASFAIEQIGLAVKRKRKVQLNKQTRVER